MSDKPFDHNHPITKGLIALHLLVQDEINQRMKERGARLAQSLALCPQSGIDEVAEGVMDDIVLELRLELVNHFRKMRQA